MPGMLVAKAKEWAACKDALLGYPAFILGNGPTLPDELGGLDGHFTVGVNRIVLRYDPVVLQWWDHNVWPDIAGPLRVCECIRITNQEIIQGKMRANAMQCIGCNAKPGTAPQDAPDKITVTGSSGISAAYWAMSLGCSPIYLLGMSATVERGKTDFYGGNPHHTLLTMRRLRRTLRSLLGMYPNVYTINTQLELDAVVEALEPIRRDREYYVGRLRAAMSSVRPGQRADAADSRPALVIGGVHDRGESDTPQRIHANRADVGGLHGLQG